MTSSKANALPTNEVVNAWNLSAFQSTLRSEEINNSNGVFSFVIAARKRAATERREKARRRQSARICLNLWTKKTAAGLDAQRQDRPPKICDNLRNLRIPPQKKSALICVICG
ncbi:MAG: hypothetical protein ACOX9E_02280 [Lentisphaeria bacterium]|jgi:hypothetical protein